MFLGAFLTLMGIVFSAMMTVYTNRQQNKYNQQMAQQQADYNTEALEKQAVLNKEAAEYNYELETNYSDRMNKLMEAGLNSHYAAQILGGVNASYQPPMVQATHAPQKNAPDFSNLLQGFMTGVPNAIGEAQDRSLAKQQQKFSEYIEERKLKLSEDLYNLQKDVEERRLTIEEGNYEAMKLINEMPVPNPLDPDGAEIPYWQANIIAEMMERKEKQKSIELANDMTQAQYDELLEEYKRNSYRWEHEQYMMVVDEEEGDAKVANLQYMNKLLQQDTSPEAMKIRMDLLRYQYMSVSQQNAINEMIDDMDESTPFKKKLKKACKVGIKILDSATGKVGKIFGSVNIGGTKHFHNSNN